MNGDEEPTEVIVPAQVLSGNGSSLSSVVVVAASRPRVFEGSECESSEPTLSGHSVSISLLATDGAHVAAVSNLSQNVNFTFPCPASENETDVECVWFDERTQHGELMAVSPSWTLQSTGLRVCAHI